MELFYALMRDKLMMLSEDGVLPAIFFYEFVEENCR